MNKVTKYSALFGALAVTAGCASSGTSVNEGSRYARLPTGATLLDSHRATCGGTVEVDERTANGHNRGTGIVLKRGQNATFDYDPSDKDDRIAWSCVGDVRTEPKSVDCPDATSHLRISRAAEGSDLLLECYGPARGYERERGRG